MPIRESNCRCRNTICYLPSVCSSMAYMGFSTDFSRVFTQTAPYFYQRTVSLMQKVLCYCHQCFAGQWDLLHTLQRPGGRGDIQVPSAAPDVQPRHCRNVHLQSQTWSCYAGSNPGQTTFWQDCTHSDMYFWLLLTKSPSSSLGVIFSLLRRILHSNTGSRLAAISDWFSSNSEAIRM